MHSKTIFLNCPYRSSYQPLLEAQIFAVHALGHVAEAALGGSEPQRFRKLCGMIERCHWSIHDLSEMRFHARGLPRLNVPFELGLAMGMDVSRDGSRPCLIFDQTPSRFRVALSDLAGFDNVRAHGNRPERLIREIRLWCRQNTEQDSRVPNDAQLLQLWRAYQSARPRIHRGLRLLGQKPTHGFAEFRQMISGWIAEAIALGLRQEISAQSAEFRYVLETDGRRPPRHAAVQPGG